MAATTSASRRCPPQPAAATVVARPRASSSAVPAHFGLETPLEVARAIHRGEIASRRLVELAPLVFAASASDEVSVAIVDRLAEEIVALARAALERLDLQGAEVDVVLGGGLIRAGDERLLQAVQRDLAVVDPRATVRPTTLPPLVGAVLRGLDELDAGPEARRRVRDELGDGSADNGGAPGALHPVTAEEAHGG